MTKFLRQSTATTIELGPLVEATDGYTYKATTITLNSAATGVILFLRNGQAAATCKTGAVSLPDPGWARVSLAATDIGVLGPFLIRLGNVTNNLPVWSRYVVVPADVYDSLILGTDNLEVDVVQITGAAVSSAAIGSVANLTTGVNVTSIAGAAPTDKVFGVNLLTITGAAVSDAMAGYFATRIPVQVVTAVNAVVATTVNANVLTITGSPVSDASIAAVANLTTGVNVTAINGGAPTNIMFNANLIQCSGAAPSNAMPDYIWNRILATPPGQTIEAGDYLKIIGAAVAGRCSGATSNPGLIVFYGPSGDARVSGSFSSGNRTGTTWVT